MSRRSTHEGVEFHDRLVATIVELLKEQNWTVEEEPRLGGLRPDIVARNPDGDSYVFELKTDPAQADLGAVAQVETYRNSLAERDDGAKGVLVVTADAPTELNVVAAHAGVELVLPSAEDPIAFKSSLAAQLPKLT